VYPSLFAQYGFMLSVNGKETEFLLVHTYIISKARKAPAAIAAHGAFAPIGIIIHHFKIIAGQFLQQHQPVCADTETPVAQMLYLVCTELDITFPVINDHKIIAGALVFVES
jgi:hypothetical protein